MKDCNKIYLKTKQTFFFLEKWSIWGYTDTLNMPSKLTHSIHLNFNILHHWSLINVASVVASIRFCHLVYFQRSIIKYTQAAIRSRAQLLTILLPSICWFRIARNAELNSVHISNSDVLCFLNLIYINWNKLRKAMLQTMHQSLLWK